MKGITITFQFPFQSSQSTVCSKFGTVLGVALLSGLMQSLHKWAVKRQSGVGAGGLLHGVAAVDCSMLFITRPPPVEPHPPLFEAELKRQATLHRKKSCRFC
eukprot:1254799-Amphidinium_carterae.2